MDVGNIEKAWEALHKGMERLKENNADSLELNIRALFLCIKGYDVDAVQEQLEHIKKVAMNDPSMKDYIISSIYDNIIRPLDELEPNELMIEAGCQVLRMICDIAPEREDISRYRKELEEALLLLRVKNDENISERIKNLTGIAFRRCPCATCKIEETMVHVELVMEVEETRKALKYLKEKYPDAYNLNKQFYERIVFTQRTQRLEEDLRAKIDKYQKKYPDEFRSITGLVFDGGLDDYADGYDGYFDRNEPYVRNEPKIGRNDPCPCGSGKNIV